MACHVPCYEPNWAHMGLYIDRKVNQRNPHRRSIVELTNAILEEWRRFLRDASSPSSWNEEASVGALVYKRTGYTHNWVNVRDKASAYIHLRIECILLKFHWGMKALIELHFQHEARYRSTFSMKRYRASCWKCSSINAFITPMKLQKNAFNSYNYI